MSVSVCRVFTQAERNLKKYGKVLICEVADETTALLKTLCTDYRGSETPLVDHPEGKVLICGVGGDRAPEDTVYRLQGECDAIGGLPRR